MIRRNRRPCSASSIATRQISTRYGGGFVQSINGLAGAERGGRRFDWFFYVNGVESPVGSTQVRRPRRRSDLVGLPRLDERDARAGGGGVLAAALRGGRAEPIEVECAGDPAPCAIVRDRLARAGVRARVDAKHRAVERTAGPRRPVERGSQGRRRAPALEAARATSGVFATLQPRRPLRLLRADGSVGQRARADTGLVAAVRDGEDPPTWVVTSATPRAASSERRGGSTPSTSRDHYAIAVFADAVVPLPLSPGGAA